MEKFLKFVFIVMIFVVLSGCYQVMTIIKINKDGSGEIVETVMLDSSFLGMGMMSGSSKDLHDPQELKSAAANYGEGVTYVSSQKKEKDNFSGYEVKYKFEDVSKVRIDESFSGGVFSEGMPGMEEETKVDQFITFDYKKGNTSRLTVKFSRPDEIKDQDFPEKDEKTSPEEIEMMSAMMKDMKFSLKLEFNGNIKKTDANFHEGSNVTLIDLDFGEMVKDKDKLNEFMDIPQDEAKKIIDFMEKNYPDMKYEPADEIYVELK